MQTGFYELEMQFRKILQLPLHGCRNTCQT